MRVGRRAGMVLAGWLLLASAASAATPTVKGNQLVDGAGKPVRLLGVNRSGTEYMCLGGYGQYFDGPSDQASVTAMKTWAINAVRLPLNETCWLGINGVKRAGASYRRAIVRYVRLLRANRLYVIVDLHVAGPGKTRARQILPMADADHAPAFWRSVAKTFRAQDGLLFDVYNEPNNISWSCWQRGCWIPRGTVPGTSVRYPAYRAAGMNQLIKAVRDGGARQPVMAGGVTWSLDLSGWLAHRPRDPAQRLVASLHTYGPSTNPDAAVCDATCRQTALDVAAQVPLVAGEIGEYDCRHEYIDDLMGFLDAHGMSYLGWTWDAVAPGGWECGSGPALILDYAGTPTDFGVGFRDHLLGLAAGG